MVKIVCWNIAKRHEPWGQLLQMRGVDIALLQEMDPDAIPKGVDVGPFKPWDTHPYDRWPAVVKLSGNVEVKWFEPVPLDVDEAEGKVAVSDLPTLAAARVTPVTDGKPSGEPFIVVSMYARWYRPHRQQVRVFRRLRPPHHLRLDCVHRRVAEGASHHRRRRPQHDLRRG